MSRSTVKTYFPSPQAKRVLRDDQGREFTVAREGRVTSQGIATAWLRPVGGGDSFLATDAGKYEEVRP